VGSFVLAPQHLVRESASANRFRSPATLWGFVNQRADQNAQRGTIGAPRRRPRWVADHPAWQTAPCASGGKSQSPLNTTVQQRNRIGLVSHHARYFSSGYTIRVVLSPNQSRIGTSSQTSVLLVSRVITLHDLEMRQQQGWLLDEP
jgi:hypothetical protein